MDVSRWAETANTVMATLETALFGESAVGVGIGAAPTASSRKHTRKANSDTMSDIEMPGSPVKRRRESVSTPSTDSGLTKPTAKSRRLSSALSNQFARSLSMSSGFGSTAHMSAVYEDQPVAASSIDMDSGMSSAFPSSSSSSSSSSIASTAAWQSSSGLSMQTSHANVGLHAHGEPGILLTQQLAASEQPPVLLRDRIMRLPAAGRSIRAREKTRASELSISCDSHDLGYSQSSLDTDILDPLSPHRGTANGRVSNGPESVENALALLLKPVSATQDSYSEEAVHAEIRQWAQEQAQPTNQTPDELIDVLNQRIVRLKELIPAILDSLGNENKHQLSGAMHSDHLHELYHAALEMGAIGDWLYQRKFHLLSVVFPTLHRSVPQLKAITRVARISEDMYELVRQPPVQPGIALSDMVNGYEELIYAKRSLYSDMLSQDGLSWKAMGIPIDAALLVRARQCLSEITEQCLTRVAQVYERRARSASAYGKEDISTEDLLGISHQALHTAGLCASLCGRTFADLTPHVMFIVAESVSWTVNKVTTRSTMQDEANVQSKSKRSAAVHGKRLDSRALRLVQACESLLKLLAYSRAVLNIAASPLESALNGHHADATAVTACETLSTSLVELSWLLAEIMAQYNADGKAANPSGSFLMFADLLVKFAKRVVEYGGPKTAQHFNIQPRLRRMQNFVHSLDPFRDTV
ncbi:hypothetical protein LPJ63_003702 [Coemansia sp. RSA 2711]|nr:hypothetical protein LPJ63_003702 [Coemansia sp. RSA 2711]